MIDRRRSIINMELFVYSGKILQTDPNVGTQMKKKLKRKRELFKKKKKKYLNKS